MNSSEAFLVFVIDAFQPGFGGVSYFIQRGDPSKRIGPFVGLKDQERLAPLLAVEDRALIDLIRGQGLSDGRSLDNRFRYIRDIAEAISRHRHLFVRDRRHGSVRKASAKERSALLSHVLLGAEASPGVIDRGLLEITEEGDLRLFWKYRGLESPLPFFALPDEAEAFRTGEGSWVKRDAEGEVRLLKELSAALLVPFDQAAKGRLDGVDLSRLVELPGERWELSQLGTTVLARAAHFDSSGIAWFESGEERGVQPLDYDLVAKAYLEGRGRVTVEGKLIFLPLTSSQGLTDEIALRLATASSPDVPVEAIAQVQKVFSDEERSVLKTQLATGSFQADLRNYQLNGVLWLSSLFDLGLGGILADEMGLGKTVQTLAFIAQRNIQRTLIVAPASVVPNWMSEIARFVPQTPCFANGGIINGGSGIFVLSYQRALRLLKEIEDTSFDVVVLDEGQFVKNVQTKTAVALRKSSSRMRLVLTGTPIENSVNDLWAHLTFTNESLNGPFNRLSRRFSDFAKNRAAADLTARAFSPLILRRTKPEVEIDLPPMLERIIYCEMGMAQRRVYETTLGAFQAMLKKGVAARVSSIALEALLRLRQCCSFPPLLPSALNPKSVRDSSKLKTALDIIDEDIRNGRKTIVFSQFRRVSDAIEEGLNERDIGSVRLDGDTLDRETPVIRFQNDPSIRVIVIGFRAGGVGLNLTAAESVVLFDPWWNPAAESQAFARAHRIGQQKTVLVSKLICSDSIEEKMLKLIADKSSLASSLSDLSEQMTADELVQLIGT